MRADDLVKTPVSHDVGALRRCNPPASRCSLGDVARHWQKKLAQKKNIVEYPDLCGTTRILDAKIQLFTE